MWVRQLLWSLIFVREVPRDEKPGGVLFLGDGEHK